jgi:hypothetical protein
MGKRKSKRAEIVEQHYLIEPRGAAKLSAAE